MEDVWNKNARYTSRFYGHDIHEASFSIFNLNNLEDYCTTKLKEIKAEIEYLEEEYVLNVNEAKCINYLIDKYLIDVPIIDFENATLSHREENILEDPRLIITYNLPLSGDYRYLLFCPDQHDEWAYTAFVLQKRVSYWDENGERVQEQDTLQPPELEKPFLYVEVENVNEQKGGTETRKVFANIKNMYKRFSQRLEKHNKEVRSQSSKLFLGRKLRILRNYKILESIGVPLRKHKNLPESYVIPNLTVRKKITLKPVVTDKTYTPEPTLDKSVYHDILQIINDLGRVFEQLPSIYSGKGEEALRDLIILYLTPHFSLEGSITGETFNKQGKTDILIRYHTSIVFIAECKFWGGTKLYIDTISQLLTYLTFRDTKASVVIFVRNKDISAVIQTVKESTSTHSNYLGFVSEENETWLNFHFHINGDPNREVKLAVLLFHLPVIHEEKLL